MRPFSLGIFCWSLEAWAFNGFCCLCVSRCEFLYFYRLWLPPMILRVITLNCSFSDGVMVSVVTTNQTTKDYKIAFVASPLSTRHYGVRSKTGRLGIWIMCQCGETFLPKDCRYERTWWRLFKKRVVRTKFDIYVFISVI